MAVRTSRRLPGFRFEAQPPPLAEVLPRMDVAVFVGFASSGPLHKPVVVEDIAHFREIFGDDLPLVWDMQQNELVYAYLAPTVHSFFLNGGRRCWVVRVAGEQAQENYFPIPGLALVDACGNLVPAFASARSAGSWSDELRVGTALLSLPLTILPISSLSAPILVLASGSTDDIVEGDLLRLVFPQNDQTTYVLLIVVQSLQLLEPDPSLSGQANEGAVQVTGNTLAWFSTLQQTKPLVSLEQAVRFSYVKDQGVVEKAIPVYQYSISTETQEITVVIAGTLADAPELGTFLRLDFATGQGLMSVQNVAVSDDQSSPPSPKIQVTGPGLLRLTEPPSIAPASLTEVERLTFELWVRSGDGNQLHLSNLGFGTTHPNYWAALPTDEQLYDATIAPSSTTPINLWQAKSSNPPYTALWQSASTPRFPLAGGAIPDLFTMPLAGGTIPDLLTMPVVMNPLPAFFTGATHNFDQQPAPRLIRDGLGEFTQDLFLDAALQDSRINDLIANADYLRYQLPDSLSAQPLKGVYAVLDVEETTLLAIPDAIHRAWRLSDVVGTFTQQLTATGPANPELPQSGPFLPCQTQHIDAPDLTTLGSPDEHGTFTLIWSVPTLSNIPLLGPKTILFLVEEATSPDFLDAITIPTGATNQLTLYGKTPGDYFYRVRASVEPIFSTWSTRLHVHIAPPARWQLETIGDYQADTLIAIQRAALRLCAARGDICVVLALPKHYHEHEVTVHVGRLKAATDLSTSASRSSAVLPLGFGEAVAFSYGTLYHPWLLLSAEAQLNQGSYIPPEGSVCGMISQRTLDRGAWTAAANMPLSEVVALTPQITSDSWLPLQNAQVNLIRQEPRGFLSLNTDTLSGDDDLGVFSVRRLLILLRRLALSLGATYVFEPNNDAFRRLVERSFENALMQLFARGAFAGSTPASAFQVVVGPELNTPQTIAEGRFVVELRVAPSLPMTFLTIRLVVQGNVGRVVTEVQ